MKKSIAFLFFTLLIFHFNYGQEKESPLVKTYFVNIQLVGGGMVGEFPVTKKSTVRLEAGIYLGAGLLITNTDGVETYFGLFPYGNAQYRQYYKFKELTKKGKPLLFNSGNFLFAQLSGIAPPLISSDNLNSSGAFSGGIGWGLQRMYQNRFVFSLGIGLGYHHRDDYNIFPIGEITLGIRLRPNE